MGAVAGSDTGHIRRLSERVVGIMVGRGSVVPVTSLDKIPIIIASNALLNLSGSGDKNLYSALTNAGTVVWSGGAFIVRNTSCLGTFGLVENLADHVQRNAVADLFVGADNAIDVIKWKEIYDTLEEATDQGEDVANVLESIRTKNL